MSFHRFHRVVVFALLAVLAGFASSCGKQAASDIPQGGPAYVLTTEGAEKDVHDVLLQILQERMKPVRVVGSDETVIKLGTIHMEMRMFEAKFTTSDRKEKVGIPTQLRATVTVLSFDGSSNWDGEHSIGFETDGPPGGFSDAARVRRRFARRLLEVAVKQLPDRGVFKNEALSPAQPSK